MSSEIQNIPQPPTRQRRKRMVAGMRVSGKHGEYIAGAEGARKSRERIYGYVIEAKENNKYLIRFDNNTEKECFSNTLKIEQDAAGVPNSESIQDSSIVAATNQDDDADNETETEDESVAQDLAVEHGVVNNGDINESADNVNEVGVESRPVNYHDRLRATRAAILGLIGNTVVMKASGQEMTWEVIENHTAPEPAKEVCAAQKKQLKELGFKNIKKILEAEKFEDPAIVSDDGTSNSSTPIRPKDIDKCTIFAKLWLLLSFKDWEKSLDVFNGCVRKYNEQQPKSMKEFSRCEFLTCFSLFIGAVVFSVSGARLWDIKGDTKTRDIEWLSLIQAPGYDKYMKLYRFKQFRMIIPKIYVQVDLKDTDPWYRFKGAIDEFNFVRKVKKLFLIAFYLIMKNNHLFYFVFNTGKSHKFIYQNNG